MTAVDVRPLHLDHRSEIESVIRATGVFNDGEVQVALEVFDDALKSASDYHVLGAFIGVRLVGYAAYGDTPGTDGTCDLYWIAVHPSAQQSGAGSALMSAVERRLIERERAARLLMVETSSRDDYASARRFYDRRGYQESARLRDFYAPGDDRIVLSKRLNAVQHPLSAEGL